MPPVASGRSCSWSYSSDPQLQRDVMGYQDPTARQGRYRPGGCPHNPSHKGPSRLYGLPHAPPGHLLTNSLRASRMFPEPVSSKICKVYPLEGLRPPTVALGVLVVSITSCSGSPRVGVGRGIKAAEVGGICKCVCTDACRCACVSMCVGSGEICLAPPFPLP